MGIRRFPQLIEQIAFNGDTEYEILFFKCQSPAAIKFAVTDIFLESRVAPLFYTITRRCAMWYSVLGYDRFCNRFSIHSIGVCLKTEMCQCQLTIIRTMVFERIRIFVCVSIPLFSSVSICARTGTAHMRSNLQLH